MDIVINTCHDLLLPILENVFMISSWTTSSFVVRAISWNAAILCLIWHAMLYIFCRSYRGRLFHYLRVVCRQFIAWAWGYAMTID